MQRVIDVLGTADDALNRKEGGEKKRSLSFIFCQVLAITKPGRFMFSFFCHFRLERERGRERERDDDDDGDDGDR